MKLNWLNACTFLRNAAVAVAVVVLWSNVFKSGSEAAQRGAGIILIGCFIAFVIFGAATELLGNGGDE